jgi:hypothetical protein
MTGDRDRFLTLRKERDGSVSFRNDDSAKIIGKGTVRIGNKNTNDPDLCRNTMKYRNTHKRRDAAEIRLHFINNK